MSSSVMRSGAMCFCAHLGGKAAEGVDQLGASAVVEGKGKSGAGVAGGGFLGPAHLVLHLRRQLVDATDVAHAHVVVHHALEVGLKIAAEQAHEEVDLSARAAKVVLKRKCVESEPGEADARSGFSNQLNAFGALLVAEESLERAAAGPAAIAVHDDGDVLGEPLGLEGGIDGALIGRELIDSQRAGWVQGIASLIIYEMSQCSA